MRQAPRPRSVQKAPLATEFVVDSQLFRNEIEGYVRELNRQMRATLNEELRRELAPKVVLASERASHEELDGSEQTAHHSSPRGGPLAESDGRFEGAGFPAANKDTSQ